MTDTEYIREELLKAVSLVSTADYLTKRGQLVSIASLKEMIADICRDVAEAGYEECAPLKPMMKDLTERIEAFGNELEERYGFLNSQPTDGE